MTKTEATAIMGLGMMLIGAAMVAEAETENKPAIDTSKEMDWMEFNKRISDIWFRGGLTWDEQVKYKDMAWEIETTSSTTKKEKRILLANLYESITAA